MSRLTSRDQGRRASPYHANARLTLALSIRRRLGRATHLLCAFVAFALGPMASANAADGSWITNFNSGWWEDSFNWAGGTIASGVDAEASFFQFTSHVHLSSSKTIGSLHFGDGQYTINGEPLVLSVSDNDGAQISVFSSQFFTGEVGMWNRITGNDALVKTGGGRLFLNDDTNSYTSLTWFMGGAVYGRTIANDGVNSAFGRGDFAFDGGTMVYTGVTATTNRDIHLQGGGGIQVSDANATLTFTASVNGAGSLYKFGNGDLTIPTTSTFTGSAVISGGRWVGSSLRNSGQTSSFGAGSSVFLNDGTLAYTGANQTTNRTLTAGSATGDIEITNAATTLNWAGAIDGSQGFTKIGPGTMTLSGATANTQSGTTAVGEGVLLLHKTGGVNAIGGNLTVGDGTGADRAALMAANQIADAGLVTVASSGTLDLSGFNETIGALAGSGVVENGNNMAFATLTVSGSTSSTFSGSLRNGAGGDGPIGLVKSGAGTLTLTQPAPMTGGVTVSGGRLKLAGSNHFPANASFAVSGGTLEVGALETTNSVNMSAGSIEGGTLAANNRFEISGGSISATLAGPAYFEKNGGGNLTFAGVGTYAGATNILSGTMTLVGAERLPDATALTVDGQLILGGAETVGSLEGTGDVELQGQLTVGNAVNTTFYGDLVGTGTLRKVGSGALQLRGSSTHDVTIIEGGHIFASTDALHGQITNNSSIYMQQSVDGVFSGTMTGNGAFNKSGGGKVTIQNAQFQTTGPMHIHDGTLVLPTGLNINGGGTLGSQPSGAIEAAGYINRRMTSEGRITATGDLLIGDLSSTDGFRIVGTLEVGAHDVILLDQDAALLGVSTTIAAGGQLTALHGLELDATDSITAAGEASVRGNITNQGLITGPATGWLTLEDDVTGAGDYAGNVRFGDGLTPGNSPAVVTFENVIFDSTSTLTLEIGGTGAGNFDQLVFNGTAQLNGTLLVDFIDLGGGEYEPAAGDVFELFTGDVTGSFANVVLPDLPDHLLWDASDFAEGVVEIAVIPPNADFDDDGFVSGTDFLTWQRRLGAANGGVERAGDANFDGVINAADLDVLRNQFGPVPEATAVTTAVPEPAAAALLLAAMAQLALRQRRL